MKVKRKPVTEPTPKVDQGRKRAVEDVQTEMARLIQCVDDAKRYGTTEQLDWLRRFLASTYVHVDIRMEDCHGK